jgi:hypothetical protein
VGSVVVAFTALVAGPAQAKQPDHQPAASKPGFDTPQLSWVAPQLHLQPEGARLMLILPPEWLPPPDQGGALGGALGGSFDPNKHWEFRRDALTTRATLGASVHLHLTNTAGSIDFGLSLLPRAAVAVLRFDPIGRRR